MTVKNGGKCQHVCYNMILFVIDQSVVLCHGNGQCSGVGLCRLLLFPLLHLLHLLHLIRLLLVRRCGRSSSTASAVEVAGAPAQSQPRLPLHGNHPSASGRHHSITSQVSINCYQDSY